MCARPRMHARACTHAHTHTHTRTQTRTRTYARKHTKTNSHAHTRTHTDTQNETHAPKQAHAHTHADTHMTRAEGSTPPRAHQPGKRGDGGGWAEGRERRGMGYSESISARTVISTTDNSRHEVPSKCSRNQFACMHVCGRLALWTSFVLHVMCMQTCTMNRVGHAQGDCIWITRSIALANAHKQNARAGMGKARSGRCRAYQHKEHAQVGAWRAQARNRYAHQRSRRRSPNSAHVRANRFVEV